VVALYPTTYFTETPKEEKEKKDKWVVLFDYFLFYCAVFITTVLIR
jgi:hypothetical protein